MLCAKCNRLWRMLQSANDMLQCCMCNAGDHIRQKMLQVGSSSEPVAYVEGILGKGHLRPVGSGHKPQINSLLKELKIA